MQRLLLLLIAVGVVLAGCGGEEDLSASGPGAAQVELLENLYGGSFSVAWRDLHPAHQRVAPRPRFVRCSQGVTPRGQLESIEVLDVFDDDAVIPAVESGERKAVRVRVTSFEGEADTFVNHAVKVGDRWRWVLNGSSYRAYRQGRCPR
jgi:hypothetical protein